MGAGLCQMSLRAQETEKNLVLAWSQEELPHKGEKKCQFRVHDEPLQLEDLDTGSRLDIIIFQRSFEYGPGLDIYQKVALVSLIPGFAAVPASERRYALSIKIERKFNGPLPDKIQVQLPDLELGDRRIQLPPLRLKRYERSGKGWWYSPDGTREIKTTKPAGKSLGGGHLVYKPADIWYEEQSLVRLSAAFRGDPYTWNPDYTKNGDESQIFGEVFFDIFGDKPIQLANDRISWHVPDDKEEQLLPIRNSKWMLKRYTTVNLSEDLDYLPDYSGLKETYDDRDRTFLAEILNSRPKRFRVTLPSTDINGQAWPIQPIEFEYHAVGVGVWTYP